MYWLTEVSARYNPDRESNSNLKSKLKLRANKYSFTHRTSFPQTNKSRLDNRCQAALT